MFNCTKRYFLPTLASKKQLFPVLAFVIPLLVRFIPEILMGPYVVGFDTIGYYVPTTLVVAAWRSELLESSLLQHLYCTL